MPKRKHHEKVFKSFLIFVYKKLYRRELRLHSALQMHYIINMGFYLPLKNSEMILNRSYIYIYVIIKRSVYRSHVCLEFYINIL